VRGCSLPAVARCPACRRRLAASAACPRDGARAPAELAAPSQAAPALDGVVVGERVGAGGFATTWAARIGSADAILKLAHRPGPASRARFAHEHEVLRRLADAGAPAPLAHGQLADGRPYLLMTRTLGRPLSALLAEAERPWTVPEAIALILALCAPLAEIHARGFVHGDLKPENLLVAAGAPPGVGIVDFGVARGAALPSAPPAGIGTFEYMAPEQLREPPPGPSSDVYAVAAILFELLVGHPPFTGDRGSIAFQLRNTRPPRLRWFLAVPPALDELVARCLDKRVGERPADARALAAELRALGALGALHPAEAAAQVAGSAAPAPAVRAPCALVAIEPADARAIAALSAAMQRHGGALARHRGARAVFAFEAGRHLVPLRAAAAAAAAVATAELGATVHVATLTVRRRADGAAAFFGPELERIEAWARGAPGVAFTDAAAEAFAPFALDAPRPMLGRAEVRAELRALAGRALAGEGPGLALITAAPGLGKTMLLEALAGALPGADVVHLAVAQPLIGGPPNAARELLERLPPGDDLDELARAAATWILDPRRDRAIEPLRAAPGALRAATTRALAGGIAAAVARRPTAILIDDAQFADDAVLDALAAAARSLAGAPLAVIVAARPELARPDLLDRVPLARALELGPLEPPAAAALARALLAPVEVIPEAVIERLRARTGGHPLELIELAAALRQSGAIAQSERGRWELDLAVLDRVLDRVPGSHLYRWLAEHTFADLPAPLLAHAELVALLGGDVSARDLREVIVELDRAGGGDRFPLDAERGLELLREAGVLVRAGEGYRFRQALLADVREAVVPAHARAVHGAAFAACSRRDDLAPDVRLARQAFHAHAAGRHALAAPLYLALGRLALARHRYVDAELALSRALAGEAAAGGVDREAAHWQRGIARYRIGRQDGAGADFEVARALARARGDRATEAAILLDLAMSLDWAVEHRAAARCVDAAATLVDTTAGPRLRAHLAMSIARSHIRANREADAIAPLERAIELATPLGDDAYEILVVALLQSAPILATVGRHEEARRQFERVLALTEAAGDRLHHGAALANRLWRPFATPDVASLCADHARVLAIAGELGHFVIEFTAEVNFAGALHHLGHGELALAHARRAVELERTRLGDAARPEAALLLARILAARCEGGEGGEGGDRGAELAAVIAAIDAHQRTARAHRRADALLTPADQALLDGVRVVAGGADELLRAAVLARGIAHLPRHELAELRTLLTVPGYSAA
jgi:eukaryotic-like serine/threonine-protein kinase